MEAVHGTTHSFLVPFLVLGFFYAISFCISFMSGWFALSQRFTKESEPIGQTRTAGPFFYKVYTRFWTRYSSAVRLTSSEDALFVSVFFLFRLCHPPLQIPWKEVKLARTKYLWRRYIVLTLGELEQIPFRIPERMARNLGILDRLPKETA